MNLLRRGIIVCLILPLAAPLLAAEWIVKFDVTEQKTTESPDGKVPPKSESHHHIETVALHQRYLTIDDEQQRAIYDFAGFRLTRLNPQANTYHTGSLYPLPAFLEHELVNRNYLGGAMRAAKVTQASVQFDRFWSESALRMESRNAPGDVPAPKIESTQAGEAVEFRYQGELVARFVPSSQKLTPALQHRFVNYLAYQCAIHPQIREALADTGALPQELVFHARNMNVATITTMRLISSNAAESDSSHWPVLARPAAPEPGDALAPVLAVTEAAAARPERLVLADTLKFVDKAVAAGHVLDAMLAVLEYGLVTGDQQVETVRKYHEKFGADPACQVYFKAFDQSSKEAAERSLKLNASIDRTNLTKAYMLDIQRANLLDRAGRQREAIAAFLDALRVNPTHTGALHDLGMIYALGYQEFDAWRCWDAARQLYPSHPMMLEVVDFERKLTVRELDFF